MKGGRSEESRPLDGGGGGGEGDGALALAASPTNSQKTVPGDDELDYSQPEFYDSGLDDKDELWVSMRRRGRRSDAVLSCPACFTTLCYDCQRHETYITQYRAMFVVNCKITYKQVVPQKSRKRKRPGKLRLSERTDDSAPTGAMVRQVCCEVCSTEVGVFDEEEVYHFYDVIPSEC